MYQKFKNTSER